LTSNYTFFVVYQYTPVHIAPSLSHCMPITAKEARAQDLQIASNWED